MLEVVFQLGISTNNGSTSTNLCDVQLYQHGPGLKWHGKIVGTMYPDVAALETGPHDTESEALFAVKDLVEGLIAT